MTAPNAIEAEPARRRRSWRLEYTRMVDDDRRLEERECLGGGEWEKGGGGSRVREATGGMITQPPFSPSTSYSNMCRPLP